MSDTALKTRSEKLTLTFMCFMLGSCRRSSLCWGVKRSLASAWMPYLSSVQWVLSSHVFFFSHHKAWSDQSFFTSANRKRKSMTFDPVRLLISEAEISLSSINCILAHCSDLSLGERVRFRLEKHRVTLQVHQNHNSHCEPCEEDSFGKTPYSSEVQQNRDRTASQCTSVLLLPSRGDES